MLPDNQLTKIILRLLARSKSFILEKGTERIHAFVYDTEERALKDLTKNIREMPACAYVWVSTQETQAYLAKGILDDYQNKYIILLRIGNDETLSEISHSELEALPAPKLKVYVLTHKYMYGCATCGAKQNLKKCSGCQAVSFCSRECQKALWNQCHHKECAEYSDAIKNSTLK